MKKDNLSPQALCPCQSGQLFQACCQSVIEKHSAKTAEQLMRSRFTAFALEDADYLSASWHPKTRPSQITLQEGTQWKALEIVASRDNSELLKSAQKSAEVQFIATFLEQGEWAKLEENSHFEWLEGHWYYHSGKHSIDSFKPQRNDSCPCASGKKFKKCCA